MINSRAYIFNVFNASDTDSGKLSTRAVCCAPALASPPARNTSSRGGKSAHSRSANAAKSARFIELAIACNFSTRSRKFAALAPNPSNFSLAVFNRRACSSDAGFGSVDTNVSNAAAAASTRDVSASCDAEADRCAASNARALRAIEPWSPRASASPAPSAPASTGIAPIAMKTFASRRSRASSPRTTRSRTAARASRRVGHLGLLPGVFQAPDLSRAPHSSPSAHRAMARQTPCARAIARSCAQAVVRAGGDAGASSSASSTSALAHAVKVASASSRFSTTTTVVGASAAGRAHANRRDVRAMMSPALASMRRTFASSGSYPPHEVIPFPSLSPTMTRGGIARWNKAEGDAVTVGDILAEVQTDKAVMEMESMEEGYLAKILVPSGDADDIPVGKAVCVMVDDPAHISAFKDYVASEDGAAADQQGASAPAEASAARAVLERPDYRSIKEQGVPLRNSRASGRNSGENDAHAAPVAQTLPADAPRMTVRDALNSAMSEEMARDEKVFIMGEEVGEYQGAYKITKGLLQKFGAERVRDTPITEAGFTGIGVGAAFMGLKPIVEFMTFNFSMQAIDHIVNSAAKTLYMSAGAISAPIVFRGPNGAAAGVGAQHSQCFAAWYMSIPGLKVLAPYDAEDARGLMKAAIRDPDPVVFLENELLYGQEFALPKEALDEDFTIPIGKAVVMKPGADVTLVAFSKMVGYCMQAAEQLREEGIDAEVINLRSLRPLDRNALASSVRKTNRMVVVEEGWPQCGVGAEISAVVNEDAFDYLDAPVERITGVDVPMPYAENLEKMALPTVEDIVRVAKRVCYR